MTSIWQHPLLWLFITLALLAACTYFPIRIQNDYLRNFVMRWVLVPISVVLIAYSYPIGIEVFKKLALNY